MLVGYVLQGQPTKAQAMENSCRDAVQSFYAWYVPKALKKSATPAWAIAAKERSNSFTAELSRLLIEDSEAQARFAGDIVGLDFDPFLYSQDPRRRYVVRTIMTDGKKCFAQVHQTQNTADAPDVTAELIFTNGQWVFANFHYGKSEDSKDENLLAILKTLRADRRTPAK
jgi:hypothetical protein